MTRQTGPLLAIDETHCMFYGPGAYSGTFGLKPDAIVLGKPVAGGVNSEDVDGHDGKHGHPPPR